MFNYIEILGRLFPDTEAETSIGGDPYVYDDIIFKTDVIPKDDIETLSINTVTINEIRPIVDINQVEIGGVMMWNGNGFVIVQQPEPDRIIQIPFSHNGKTKKKWLPQYGKTNKSSDKSPFVVPVDMNIASLTFVSEENDNDTSIEIWVTSKYASSSEIVKVYTADIISAKTAVLSNIDVPLQLGDKVSLYITDSVKSPMITLWCNVPADIIIPFIPEEPEDIPTVMDNED